MRPASGRIMLKLFLPFQKPTRSIMLALSPLHIVLLAPAGRARESLRLLLQTLPQVCLVDQAEDGQTACQLLQTLHPQLVLVDVTLPAAECALLFNYLQTNRNGTRSLALILNADQQHLAQTAGADYSLRKGFTFIELAEAIETALHHPQPPPGPVLPEHSSDLCAAGQPAARES